MMDSNCKDIEQTAGGHGHKHDNGNGNGQGDSADRAHKQRVRPIRRVVDLSERRFDVRTLPEDMQRVYGHLSKRWGEEYGLLFVFTMRTAVELHRAWHMTLLTSNILQKIKDTFGLRMTWNIGVIRLKFRVEDGGFELHRKVPYDYDSEYQDIYYRIAMALIEGKINVHEALLYQTETKEGRHTASSGLFLRDFPGRLVLYPLQAATCAVIFFSGTWLDAGVAAICGLAAGLLEYTLTVLPSSDGVAKVLVDVVIGTSTGIIGGLWYVYARPCCVSSIFLGTLYWFFYGTAFVIGLLEIIAGELETGVTRFVAVSVKTFVLSLGASIGLMMTTGNKASKIWFESNEFCDSNFVLGKHWRIPLYLLCCVAVLGQYRLPLDRYWLGMAVQLIAYEVQYLAFNGLSDHSQDHLDTAASNMAGAVGGVLCASSLSWAINICRELYCARLLSGERSSSVLAELVYHVTRFFVKVSSFLKIGRESDILKLAMEKRLREQSEELNDPAHPRNRIELQTEDENLILETIVGGQDINVWSILMPAVYQLVPGSMIARFWFHSIFPPPQDISDVDSQESAFSNLFVISTSLALGLIFGFAVVQIVLFFVNRLAPLCRGKEGKSVAARQHMQDVTEMMYTATGDMDPGSISAPESDGDCDGDGLSR